LVLLLSELIKMTNRNNGCYVLHVIVN